MINDTEKQEDDTRYVTQWFVNMLKQVWIGI